MSTFHSSLKAHAAPRREPHQSVRSAIWPWAHSMIAGNGVADAPGSFLSSVIEGRAPNRFGCERSRGRSR